MKQMLLFSLFIFLLYIKNCIPQDSEQSCIQSDKCWKIILKNDENIDSVCVKPKIFEKSYYSIISSTTIIYYNCKNAEANCYDSTDNKNCNKRKASSKENMCCEIKKANEGNLAAKDQRCIEINKNEFERFQPYPKEYYENYENLNQIICSDGSFIKMKLNYIILNIITLIAIIIW